MPRIKVPQTLSQTKTFEELRKYVSQMTDQLLPAFNGNISLVDNASTMTIQVTFPGANTEVGTLHGLGRVPNGYIVVGRTSTISVFNGTTPNTTTNIYLQASGAGIATVMVF